MALGHPTTSPTTQSQPSPCRCETASQRLNVSTQNLRGRSRTDSTPIASPPPREGAAGIQPPSVTRSSEQADPSARRSLREVRRVSASQSNSPFRPKWASQMGYRAFRGSLLGYWHRTVQKTEQPVLAATSPWPLTPVQPG